MIYTVNYVTSINGAVSGASIEPYNVHAPIGPDQIGALFLRSVTHISSSGQLEALSEFLLKRNISPSLKSMSPYKINRGYYEDMYIGQYHVCTYGEMLHMYKNINSPFDVSINSLKESIVVSPHRLREINRSSEF